MKKIIAISGSLRKESYNTKLCRTIQTLMQSDDIEVEVMTLENIPFYNQDLENSTNPEIIEAFKAKVAAADAIIFATPEYNNMIPGGLKNAIDWLAGGNASNSVLADKPTAIVGASTGGFGTVRAQNILLQLLAHVNMTVKGKYKFPVSHAADVFDESGEMVDEKVKLKLQEFLKLFISQEL